MNVKSQSGQVLVLILLVVLVGMTIGLSVASRTLTTMKNQSELTMSNRAFSAAEAGVERALLELKAGNSCAGNSCSASIDGINTTVDVVNAGGSTLAYGISSLPRDEVFQLNLQGYSTDSVDLYWGTNGDNSNCTQSASAVVLTLVYQRGGEYGVAKQTLDPCAARSSTGFSSDAISINPEADTITLQDGTQKRDYGYKKTIQLRGASSEAMTQAGDTLISLRAKLMYVGQKQVAFNPYSPFTLPEQGQQITSTAIVGGQQRTVKVLKSNDTVPAIFDYALFNGSTSNLNK